MAADGIAVTALVVSLVALIVTLLQAAQQYAATAYNYRHCSKRAVGEWHRHRHRRFIWSELRFEVTFDAPIISVGVMPSTVALLKTEPMSEKHDSQSSKPMEAQYQYHSHKGTVATYTLSDDPWFLSLRGTRPEARCTWLSLLNDLSDACLQFDLDVRQISYDFMPQGITKPMAQIDRKSFLTLMSLYRVQWAKDSDSLVGAGEHCEISSRDLLNFGIVYSYHAFGVRRKLSYYLTSEKARSAMFNRFDLGFHTHLTHDPDEIYNSLLSLVEKEVADTVKGYNEANDGWSPGLGETIGCFAEIEMPKCVDHEADKFLSIYSGIPAHSSLCDPPVLRLLAGKSLPHSTSEIEELQRWRSSYLSHELKEFVSPADIIATFDCVCQLHDSNLGGQFPWSLSQKCFPLIRGLDLNFLSLAHTLSPSNENQVQREFARMQLRFGCNIFHDASTLASEAGGFWIDFVAAAQAEYYVKIARELSEKFPGGNILITQKIVINRLLRGALWYVHNGNAPTQQERIRECSLNSRWLSDVSTIWVD